MNLSISDWKDFKIGKLYTRIESGKCSDASSLIIGNEINYVGAKRNDNGVMSKVTCEKALVSTGNCIAFICQGEGSAGYATYQDRDFIGASSLKLGYIDGVLNSNIGNFLATLHCLEKPKYNHGRGWGKTLFNSTVKLPIRKNVDGTPFLDETYTYSDDGYVPDWKFMENYIKSLHYKPLTTVKAHGKKLKLDMQQWKEFTVVDLFEKVYKGKAYTDEDLYGINSLVTVPYITRTDSNNGCKYIANVTNDFHIEQGNAISIGDTTATCFYQKDDFITGDHMVILRAGWLNQLRGLFMVGLFNQERLKYSYGRAYKIDNIKHSVLPKRIYLGKIKLLKKIV